jgi:Fe2+ transport system protein FeoA
VAIKSKRLSDIKVGARAVVRGVERRDPVGWRLLEMGFVPGTPVKLVRRAPMGDPMEIQLRGYSLSLRREEGESIFVE